MTLLLPDLHQLHIQLLNLQPQPRLIKRGHRRVICSLRLVNISINELIKEVQILSKQIIWPIETEHIRSDRFAGETDLYQSLDAQYAEVFDPTVEAENGV